MNLIGELAYLYCRRRCYEGILILILSLRSSAYSLKTGDVRRGYRLMDMQISEGHRAAQKLQLLAITAVIWVILGGSKLAGVSERYMNLN